MLLGKIDVTVISSADNKTFFLYQGALPTARGSTKRITEIMTLTLYRTHADKCTLWKLSDRVKLKK